ncbi:MAG: zinc-binding dehydrogenase [Alcaligenaceae bacterium]
MKAQIIREHGDIANITFEAHWPDPVAGPDDVVLEVKACTLNYHDLFTLRGMPGIKLNLPLIMGIDVAGVVASVGSNVTQWRVGDRVLVDPFDPVTGSLLGERSDGGLAELVKVSAKQLLSLPDEVSFAEGACLPVAYGTAYRMMVTRGQLKAGEKVLILGASGGVGTCCVQLAKMAGCHVVVAASSEEKIERLKQLGAADGVNYATEDWMRQIQKNYGKARFGGVGAAGMDVVVNFTGGDTWVPSLRCLTNNGRLLTCGATAGFDPKEDIRYIWTFELNIIGSNGWLREDLSSLLDLVKQKNLKPVVSETLDLSQTQLAFDLLQNRKVFGKIVIVP